MVVIRNANGSYSVQGKSGEWWTVSADCKSCNCPKFKFVNKGREPCHHMDEASSSNAKTIQIDGKEEWNPEKYKELMNLDGFCNRYGDEQYKHLLKIGEIIFYKGLVRKLE